MPSHHTPLHRAAASVFSAATQLPVEELKVESPPKPDLGDLAIGCFALAKAKKANPAQLAKDIAADINARLSAAAPASSPHDMLAKAEASGPYVNFRVNRASVFAWLVDATQSGTLLPRTHGQGKTICIDYSSPNVSKHLAYHHIRSTMIGHALVQSFRALGYRVIGINHLGDWGTTHGMLIGAYKKWGAEEKDIDVSVLNELYVRFRNEVPNAEDEGRAWFKKLEDGDPEARELWQRFRDISLAEYQTVYDALGVKFDEVRGESAYEADLPRVMAELEGKGLVQVSDGAQVVELEGEKTPILLKTRDGTTLYATRDVAAAQYRWNTYQFDRSLYVVDRGQSLHFRQLFKLLAKMGYEWASKCEHVPFGLVRIGGKKTGTRKGNVVLLKDVLDRAFIETINTVAKVNPELPAGVAVPTAKLVGNGGVVFANLASQREKDIDFEWDKVLSLEGDSGPYLQMQHARCASIARKAGDGARQETVTSSDGIDFGKLTTDNEWAVAKKLLDFPELVVRSTDNAEPHIICHYLLELCGEFSRWYTQGNGDPALRVLVDDPAIRRARLALVAAVQATLREGLSLLGIVAPDQM